MAVTFSVNGTSVTIDAPAATPLLWVIREQVKLTGTKFGCGAGLCGACMIHIDGERAFSCQVQLSEVSGRSVKNHRRPVARLVASSAKGVACGKCATMRLLPVRADHECRSTAGEESETLAR